MDIFYIFDVYVATVEYDDGSIVCDSVFSRHSSAIKFRAKINKVIKEYNEEYLVALKEQNHEKIFEIEKYYREDFPSIFRYNNKNPKRVIIEKMEIR